MVCVNFSLSIQFLGSTPPAVTVDSTASDDDEEEEEGGGEGGTHWRISWKVWQSVTCLCLLC